MVKKSVFNQNTLIRNCIQIKFNVLSKIIILKKKDQMCRQFVTAGKLSKLRKLLGETYNEEIEIKLLGEIDKEEEELEEDIEEELEEQRRHKKDHDAFLTENIPVITYKSGKKYLTRMKWGIKFDPENKSPLIFNSRDDTVKEKEFWQKLFDQNRLLIPMFGFYEWVDKGLKKKVKTKITLVNKELFLVPGLFWKNNEDINEFTLITTSPNKFMTEIHNRMPVIFDDKKAFNYFTDSAEENYEKLKPVKSDMMKEEEDTTEKTIQGSLF